MAGGLACFSLRSFCCRRKFSPFSTILPVGGGKASDVSPGRLGAESMMYRAASAEQYHNNRAPAVERDGNFPGRKLLTRCQVPF